MKSTQTIRVIKSATLLHLQSHMPIVLPQSLVIHIGKPNEQLTPDLDVSGFQNSQVVSRIHAAIRREKDTYFIEDLKSANGTYLNHTFLVPENRYRLNSGDRISLGKGDLVSFVFGLF